MSSSQETPLPVDVRLFSFRPKTGSMDAWNAAYVRVEDYLRAHRIHNRLHQSRLIQEILERAARRHEVNPALDPTTLAADETAAAMDEWFSALLEEKNLPHDRICGGWPTRAASFRWTEKVGPYAFLDRRAIPPDFASAMRESSIQAGPDLAVSSMVPREIDLGPISEAAGETLERIEKWPIVRTLLLWAVFVATLTGIFRATR
jgi:hypothetical protein